MNLKTILDVEIEERSAKLSKLEPGTKEYSDAVEGLAKMMDRRIEIEKLETSEAQTEKQMIEERNARWLKIGCDILLGIGGLGLTYWGAKASFKFEETGTITSQAGKKFMDGIFRAFRK